MGQCLFCQIAEKRIPAKILTENERFVVFHDIQPQAPAHVLIIPREHVEKIADLKAHQESLVGGLVLMAQQVAAQQGWQDYRLVLNNGTQAGQSVFHLHLHLLAGRPMKWPPG